MLGVESLARVPDSEGSLTFSQCLIVSRDAAGASRRRDIIYCKPSWCTNVWWVHSAGGMVHSKSNEMQRGQMPPLVTANAHRPPVKCAEEKTGFVTKIVRLLYWTAWQSLFADRVIRFGLMLEIILLMNRKGGYSKGLGSINAHTYCIELKNVTLKSLLNLV